MAFDGETGDGYGGTVAVSEDIVAVGAEYDNNGTVVNFGSVYLYNTDGEFLEKLLAPEGGSWYQFGIALSISGNRLAAGANGVAYIYLV